VTPTIASGTEVIIPSGPTLEIQNDQTLTPNSGGAIDNQDGGTMLIVVGTLDDSGTVTNDGTITDSGSIQNRAGANFNNNADGIVNLTDDINGNRGSINNAASGTINNSGSIDICDTVDNSGSIYNFGSLILEGTATCDTSGQTGGIFDNFDLVTNECGSTYDVTQAGVTYTNSGTVNL